MINRKILHQQLTQNPKYFQTFIIAYFDESCHELFRYVLVAEIYFIREN